VSRFLRLALVGVLGLLLVGAVLTYALAPKIGTWAVRTKVLPKVEAKLGRGLHVGSIKVGWGTATLSGVVVDGKDGDVPLAEVETVEVHFDPWSATGDDVKVRTVAVDGLRVTLVRTPDGDNFSDVVARLRGGSGGGGTSVGGRKITIDEVSLTRGSATLSDAKSGVRATVGDISAHAVPRGEAAVTLERVQLAHKLGPELGAEKIAVTLDLADPRTTAEVTVSGGKLTPWSSMSLTGIDGKVKAESETRWSIDLAGGYGGVAEKLWTAAGWISPALDGGALSLRADRFTLDKLTPILEGSPIESPGEAAIDAQLDIGMAGDQVTLTGAASLSGLTLFHPWLAAQPVKNLGFEAEIRAAYDRKRKLATLEELAVTFRRVRARVDGAFALPGGEDAGVPRHAPRLLAHVVMPEMPCQAVLEGIPPELAPALQGFRLKGSLSADVRLEIDWANLDGLLLDGSLDPWRCKALEAPSEASPDRLMHEFEHVVEVEENNFTSFVVGPSNPDFVPYDQVSPFLIKSLTTTEDAGFFKHRGFIVREFRSALVKNLKERYFKYGASSITMQLVKNVLLVREKTLSRKLQELVLTWYIETALPKERLLEIYVNVIEFGPGIYGIGPAAKHYFGKPASQLTPLEAAFFSSILPNPKKRYLQYCEGTLSKWGDAKVQRIVKLMHSRGHITDEEYAATLETPLAFDRTSALPEAECKKMVRVMLKKTRPTLPPRRTGG
jgi:Transglycosylase